MTNCGLSMAHPARLLRGLLLTAAVFGITSGVSAVDTPVVDEETHPNAIFRGRISDRFEIYNPHSREHLMAIRDMGVHQVSLDWPNLHAEATQLGLDVVIANWWTDQTEVSEIEKRMLTEQLARKNSEAMFKNFQLDSELNTDSGHHQN